MLPKKKLNWEAKMKRVVLFILALSSLSLLFINCTVTRVPYLIKKEQVYFFYVEGASIEDAFSKAIETAMELKYVVNQSTSTSALMFVAIENSIRLVGGTITEMEFVFTKDNNKIKCMVRIKSSKSNKKVLDQFKAIYGKKVRIVEQ
jgi:hypothetical protein